MILYNVFENNYIQSFREFPDVQSRFQKERTYVFTFPDLANGFDSVFDTGTPLGSFGLPFLFGTPAAAVAQRCACVQPYYGISFPLNPMIVLSPLFHYP